MQSNEAAKILALLAAYYPQANWPDATIRAWTRELAGHDANDAAQAVRELARSQARPPALASLLEACNAVTKRRAHERATERGLEVGSTHSGRIPDDVREKLREIGFTKVGRDMPEGVT